MTPTTAAMNAVLVSMTGLVIFLLLFMVLLIYLAFRNEKVYKRRVELIIEERDETLAKIHRGILAEVDFTCVPSHVEMLLQFWVPLDKFKRAKA